MELASYHFLVLRILRWILEFWRIFGFPCWLIVPKPEQLNIIIRHESGLAWFCGFIFCSGYGFTYFRPLWRNVNVVLFCKSINLYKFTWSVI